MTDNKMIIYEHLYPDLKKEALFLGVSLGDLLLLVPLALSGMMLAVFSGVQILLFISGVIWILKYRINGRTVLSNIKCWVRFLITKQQDYRW